MASIQPYNLKSGELRYEVYVSNGINSGTGKQEKIHKRGFKSWEEADTFAKITQGDLAKGEQVQVNPEKLTIEEFLELWLNEYKQGVKEGTRIVYRATIKAYIVPHIGKYQLHKYSRTDHQKFINKLFRLKGKGRGKNGLNHSTVKLVNGTLSGAFKKAVQLGYLKENPAKHVEFPRKQKKVSELPDFYSVEEVDRFLEAAKKERDPLWYPLFLLIFDSGLRKGEALGVQWSDFDLQNKTLKIQRERLLCAEMKENVGKVIVDETKTPAGTREIPITERTKQALWEFYKYFYDLVGVTPMINNNDDFVFIYTTNGKRKGEVVRGRTVNIASDRIADRAGLRRMPVHNGRHTYAVRLRQAGVSLEDIKDLLGHEDLSTTQIYATVSPEVKKRSINQLENYIAEQQKKHS